MADEEGGRRDRSSGRGVVWAMAAGAASAAALAIALHGGEPAGSFAAAHALALQAGPGDGSPPGALPGVAGTVMEVPLHEHEGRLWIPIQAADGTGFRFILGTGSLGTLYSESGAARQAGAGDLFMGGLPGAPVTMEDSQTLPDSLFFHEGEQFDGQLAPNTLNGYDLLLDGPGGKLLLRRIGGPPTWDGYALSDPVRLRVYHGTVLTVPVDLGGTTVQAMLELSAPQIIGNPGVGAAGLIAEGGATRMRIGATEWDLPGVVQDHPLLRRFSAPEDPFALVGGVIAVDCPIALSYVRAELRTCLR